MIAMNLSKQKTLDANQRAIHKINLKAKLGRAGNKTMLFIIEEAKEAVLNLSQRTVKVLVLCL